MILRHRLVVLAVPLAVSLGLATPAHAWPLVIRTATFAPWNMTAPPTAVTYDQALVRTGASISVVAMSSSEDRTTVVLLQVHGLAPDHRYGVHVHRNRCGAVPAAAGSHYQNVPDPVAPSVDPAYANPRNEVWLDLSTDHAGAGSSFAILQWRFRAGQANSVVLHADSTMTGSGHAGTAGPRVACLTVPFQPVSLIWASG